MSPDSRRAPATRCPSLLLPCCSALVFEPQIMAYVPAGKEWLKKKAFSHLRRLADQGGR